VNTPWGKSDSKITLTCGISWVGTPSHGGFAITPSAALTYLSTAAVARAEKYGSYYFFEEDCDASIVLFELPAPMLEKLIYLPPTADNLLKDLSRWHADYLIERDITPDPDGLAFFEANRKQDAMRAQQHPDLIISASGDWADWVPKGRVGVITADHKRYTVPAVEYTVKTLNLLSQHSDVQAVA